MKNRGAELGFVPIALSQSALESCCGLKARRTCVRMRSKGGVLMSLSKVSYLAVGVAIGVAVAASQLAGAASTPIGELGSNEGVFVNKTTFKIVKGASKGDPQAQIVKLGARPVTEGAIIFRAGEKLYIVDAVPGGTQMDLMFEGAFAPPG
jgi:hypothetical protein